MEMDYTTGVHMMRSSSDCGSSATNGSEEDMEIRKGPWTEEEDSVLMSYITTHGEGHWNSVARSAGKHSNIYTLIKSFTILCYIYIYTPCIWLMFD